MPSLQLPGARRAGCGGAGGLQPQTRRDPDRCGQLRDAGDRHALVRRPAGAHRRLRCADRDQSPPARTCRATAIGRSAITRIGPTRIGPPRIGTARIGPASVATASVRDGQRRDGQLLHARPPGGPPRRALPARRPLAPAPPAARRPAPGRCVRPTGPRGPPPFRHLTPSRPPASPHLIGSCAFPATHPNHLVATFDKNQLEFDSGRLDIDRVRSRIMLKGTC